MKPGDVPQKVLAATGNPGKLRELSELFARAGRELLGAHEAGWDQDVEEDQDTLAGNAAKKALACGRATGRWALADDTGLLVDALGGAPGVHSARYAGPEQDAAANRAKLLQSLEGCSQRGAAFECVLVLASPDGATRAFSGSVEGRILEEEAGEGGFGYDCVFQPAGWERSFAQMTPDEKNRISHRARALENLVAWLQA